MTPKQNSLRSWSPSPRQREWLEKYALGYSWHRSAVLCGIPASTYHDWFEAHPELRQMGEDLRTKMIASLGDAHSGLVTRCYQVLERVGDGEGDLAPASPLALWAERILSKTTWPVLMVRGLSGAGVELNGQQALRLIEAGNEEEAPETRRSRIP